MRVSPAIAFQKLRETEIAARDSFVALSSGAGSPVGGFGLGGHSRRQDGDVVGVEVAARHGSDDASQPREGGRKKPSRISGWKQKVRNLEEKAAIKLLNAVRRCCTLKYGPKKTGEKFAVDLGVSRAQGYSYLSDERHYRKLGLILQQLGVREMWRQVAAEFLGKVGKFKVKMPKFRRRQTQEAT